MFLSLYPSKIIVSRRIVSNRRLVTSVQAVDDKKEFFNTGLEFTLAVGTDGSIYVWGKNDRYQLGFKNVSPISPDNLTLQVAEKRRSIKPVSHSYCVPVPTKLPVVYAYVLPGAFFHVKKENHLNRHVWAEVFDVFMTSSIVNYHDIFVRQVNIDVTFHRSLEDLGVSNCICSFLTYLYCLVESIIVNQFYMTINFTELVSVLLHEMPYSSHCGLFAPGYCSSRRR